MKRFPFRTGIEVRSTAVICAVMIVLGLHEAATAGERSIILYCKLGDSLIPLDLGWLRETNVACPPITDDPSDTWTCPSRTVWLDDLVTNGESATGLDSIMKFDLINLARNNEECNYCTHAMEDMRQKYTSLVQDYMKASSINEPYPREARDFFSFESTWGRFAKQCYDLNISDLLDPKLNEELIEKRSPRDKRGFSNGLIGGGQPVEND